MPTPNPTVSFTYSVSAQVRTGAQLAVLLAAVPLDASSLVQYGVNPTPTVDSTTHVGSLATRSLTYSLLPAFTPIGPTNPLMAEYQGSIVSTSPNDVYGGSGLQRLRIFYQNTAGVSEQIDVNPNGQVPVPLKESDLINVVQLLPLIGTPQGTVSIFSRPNGTGQQTAVIPVNGQWSFASSSPLDNAGQIGAQVMQLNYNDALGNPHTEVITLNGTNPVNTVGVNYAAITNIIFGAAGAAGSARGNIGNINVFGGLNGQGPLMGQLPMSFMASFPVGTAQYAPFMDLFTHVIAAALQSLVTASVPVVTLA
jgi:hypothetical protein